MDQNFQVLIAIFGAALCLGGWVLFWVGSRLIGVAIGMGFGFVFGEALCYVLKLHASPVPLVLLACSLLGAIGGIFFVRAVTALLFGLMGFLFGALIARVGVDLYYATKETEFAFTPAVIAIILGSGVLLAIFAIVLQKAIVIIVTSYIGASFLVLGVPAAAAHMPVAFLAIFVASVIWQAILVTQLIPDKPPPPEPAR